LSLIWNSMMSWAGGWFFLMAAEIFTLGQRDFRLPGLGSYLQEAANHGDMKAILWGLATIILVIVAIDQLVWRPILAWAERFKLSCEASDIPQTSWFYDALLSSHIAGWISRRLLNPLGERLDRLFLVRLKPRQEGRRWAVPAWVGRAALVAAAAGLAYGLYLAALLVWAVPPTRWLDIAVGLGATFLRVMLALTVALAWTIPVGVAIGTNPRLSTVLQPIVQIVASIPATAVFPVILLFLVSLTGGLNLAAILLMLMGTQWYLLFNIIAGAAAIPQDLKYTATLMSLHGWARWRTLILPALFPYIVTGAIVAAGGAWNASIVSEYVNFGGETLVTVGIGSTIAQAAAEGDYPVLLTATLTMVMAVMAFNQLVWQRLFRLAEENYHLE
jgi:NitT/TauT family transport system permease protein